MNLEPLGSFNLSARRFHLATHPIPLLHPLIIKCDNPDCQVVIRPQTRPDGIENQLQRGCTCAAALRHFECDVTSTLVYWLGGVKFSNHGQHAHRRPAHILHLSGEESRRFKEIVTAHPTVGPLT